MDTPTAGLGFKPQHFAAACACPAVGQWYEVHAENYMAPGGPRLAMLEALRAGHPLSLHGVGLSLASDAPPCRSHLDRLRGLVDRFEPFLISEHLAWSRWQGVSLPDLFPFPRTRAALARIAENVDRTQTALGRRILIENPSLYVALDGHEMDEGAFLNEIVRRTGCGLLLDVNNVFVSARNLGFSPQAYLADLPHAAISEIHLAGHTVDPGGDGRLLIDSHDTPVSDAVWDLYDQALALVGPCPTLIERDGEVPNFEDLMSERNRAARKLADLNRHV
ncbi:MAG: DUF692 domain-containing protein [Phenylobacterium sp.]|nr:DUF692 domain-containing protein [Phenylobacterium sp.]